MRSGFIGGLCAAVATVALAAPGMAQEKRVNVYNWSDYIGETTLGDFTRITGIAVTYDVYDSNDVVEAKLLAGKSGYDIVAPSAEPYFSRLIKAGIFQPLDKEKIPNLSNLDPALMKAVETSDPGNKYGVIYQWGTNGIGLNVAKIKERMPDAPVDSWDMVFKPEIVSKFADCGVTLLNAATEIVPLALTYLGKDPNSQDAKDLRAAEDLVKKIRPYIRYFHSSNYINDLASGDICLAVGWSGDINQAATRARQAGNGVEVAYAMPKEGTMMWFDLMGIPVDAPHPEEAHAFINFVFDPEVMAGITNTVAYGNAVPASLPMVREDVRTDPNVFPPEEVRARLFTLKAATPEYERLRTRAWTRIQTGK